MKTKTRPLFTVTLILLAGCGVPFSSEDPTHDPDLSINEESYFPLEVGKQWTYRITEADNDTTRIAFPAQFTVSVVGEQHVAGKDYFLLTNFFVPGPSLPDTVLVRSNGSKVFIRFPSDDEEYTFYLFAPEDTTWRVPMFVNPERLYPYAGSLTYQVGNYATVRWGLYQSEGRDEADWEEVFAAGIGRTTIVSVSQAFGKVVWQLVVTN